MKRLPVAPAGLSDEARKLWVKLLDEMGEWEHSQLMLLANMLRHFDKAEAARMVVDSEGLTVQDRFGQTKPHPCLHSMCEHSAKFQAAYKLLGLDLEYETT